MGLPAPVVDTLAAAEVLLFALGFLLAVAFRVPEETVRPTVGFAVAVFVGRFIAVVDDAEAPPIRGGLFTAEETPVEISRAVFAGIGANVGSARFKSLMSLTSHAERLRRNLFRELNGFILTASGETARSNVKY